MQRPLWSVKFVSLNANPSRQSEQDTVFWGEKCNDSTRSKVVNKILDFMGIFVVKKNKII